MKSNIVYKLGVLYGLICWFQIIGHAQTPTWAEDIAPIFYNKCTQCHHNGGIAPFSLVDYTTAVAYKNIIKYDVENGIMPPWPPDTNYTRFIHERVLSSSEVQKIVDWVNNGTPQGNLANAPAPPTYTNVYQLTGTPDIEVKIPLHTSQATTSDEYVCFSIPLNNPVLRYVKAVEIVPGNPAIVHHVIVTADTSSSKPNVPTTYTNCFNVMGQFGLAGYDPGAGAVVLPSIYPAKFGIPLYPNCNIVFQLHYPKGSIGQVDSTKVRLFLYPLNETNIREVYTAPLLQNWNLNIPDGAIQTYTNECPGSGIFANCKFFVPITVLSAHPHQHLIGKSIVNYAVSPSYSDTIKLIRITNWDFDWQGYYFFKKPVIVPANYKWIGVHTYDNTSSNPNNPNNPPQTMIAGYQTTDEMFFDSFMFALYQPGDENINLDSLMTVSVQQFTKSERTTTYQMILFPNPANEKLNIFTYPPINEKTKILIKDINGRKVHEIEVVNAKLELDLSAFQDGFYFIEWKSNCNQILSREKVIIQKN
ncbi:MAG: hypothetical protein KatS3mg027_2520 [Bacteroidia bacterium]|nr:MAG: hypothetical protein KatS3mg027_2520 [Bacteroidia bacterium]